MITFKEFSNSINEENQDNRLRGTFVCLVATFYFPHGVPGFEDNVDMDASRTQMLYAMKKQIPSDFGLENNIEIKSQKTANSRNTFEVTFYIDKNGYDEKMNKDYDKQQQCIESFRQSCIALADEKEAIVNVDLFAISAY